MPWQKGQSGNLNGRPKQTPFQDQLRIVMGDSKLKGLGVADGKKSALRLAVEQLVLAAAKGEQWAIKEIADRTDGKPAQTIDQTINDARPKTEFTRDDLGAIIDNASDGSSRTSRANGRGRETDSVH